MSKLYCVECGEPAKEDHNSFWCDACRKLWPKNREGYWEDMGQLRRKTRFVVANCGFENRAEAEKFKHEMGFPDSVCSPAYELWDEVTNQ